MAINVYYQTGQVITLAMHKTVYVMILAVNKTQRAAQLKSHIQTPEPEIIVYGFMPEREYAHGYAAHLDMSHGYPFAVVGIDIHHIALIGSSLYGGYRTREYPGMETQQRFLLTSLQYCSLLHIS
jgi:hypothetical protein